MDMKKKVAVAALAVLLAVVLVVIFAFSGNEEEAPPETEPVVTAEETTVATTEATIPGLEDSIFDEETEETTEATEKTEETEETEETAPPEQDNTKPTKPKPTETEPAETDPAETEPTEAEPTVPSVEEMDYETFQKLSPAEQQAFVESFDSIEEFFAWYNAAKEAYEKANAPIEVGGGAIDIGAIVEGEE